MGEYSQGPSKEKDHDATPVHPMCSKALFSKTESPAKLTIVTESIILTMVALIGSLSYDQASVNQTTQTTIEPILLAKLSQPPFGPIVFAVVSKVSPVVKDVGMRKR